MRICYLNGQFVPENEASISIFDRGFLFSDGVYEVSAVMNGQLVDNRGHLARLSRSLEKLGIPAPYTTEEIIALQQQLIEKNNMQDGGIYLQVTRGCDTDRDFLPTKPLTPTFLLLPQPKDLRINPLAEHGATVMSAPEIRWAKRDIKAIGLLGAVLAKQAAKNAGFDDAWFVEDGFVTEGSSSNAFFIKDKTLVTTPASEHILSGITRQSLMRFADETGLQIQERNFTIAEAQAADEAFMSAATLFVAPVIQIDDKVIGDGKPGKYSQTLREIYIETAMANRLP